MALMPPSSLHLPSTWVFRLGTLLGTPSMRGLLPCLLGCLRHTVAVVKAYGRTVLLTCNNLTVSFPGAANPGLAKASVLC